jgi:hypothetical protein
VVFINISRTPEETRNRPVALNRPAITRPLVPTSTDDWDAQIDRSKAKTYIMPGLSLDGDDSASNDDKSDDQKPYQIKSNVQVQCMKPAARKKYYEELRDSAKLRQLEEKDKVVKDEHRYATHRPLYVQRYK